MRKLFAAFLFLATSGAAFAQGIGFSPNIQNYTNVFPSDAIASLPYTTTLADLSNVLQASPGGSDGTVTLISPISAGNGAVQCIQKADNGAGKVIVSNGATIANLYVQFDWACARSNGATWTVWSWQIKPVKQVFTVSGIWTKDPLAQNVRVMAFGQGGGGSSGQRRAVSNIRTGGGGGGVGKVVQMFFAASILGATETVTIPTDATAGASVTVNDTVGTIGTQGSPTLFGGWISAAAGIPGGATSVGGAAAALGSAQPAGGSNLPGDNIGVSNAGTSSAINTSTPALALDGQCAVGSPGAGATAANVIAPTTAAPNGSAYSGTKAAGGVIASAGNPGGNGADITDTDKQMGGGGGAGGWWATSTAGTGGGSGGAPCSAGGGGGASDNGFNSGAGGVGARGEVRIWQTF